MRFNSKSERNLAFEQALLRYDIIKKGLLKISKEELSSAQETTLEELDEMFGVVKQLTCGEAVADLIAYAFLGYAGAIKALRSDLGLTQTQASEKTGVPVATIRQIERGAVYLSEERLKEYANKLGYKDDIVDKIVEFKYPVSVVRTHVEEELANYGIGSYEADEELLRSLIEKV